MRRFRKCHRPGILLTEHGFDMALTPLPVPLRAGLLGPPCCCLTKADRAASNAASGEAPLGSLRAVLRASWYLPSLSEATALVAGPSMLQDAILNPSYFIAGVGDQYAYLPLRNDVLGRSFPDQRSRPLSKVRYCRCRCGFASLNPPIQAYTATISKWPKTGQGSGTPAWSKSWS